MNTNPKPECPVCEAKGKPCTRFVSGAHVFKHYGVQMRPTMRDALDFFITDFWEATLP